MFKRVLIANRGEIAIRIARAAARSASNRCACSRRPTRCRCTPGCDGHGARDRQDRRRSGAPPISTSRRVVAAAKASGCDCVHPGYGFLSENAAFAERCRRRGLALHRSVARRRSRCSATRSRPARFAESQGIPVVPGSAGGAGLERRGQGAGATIGYPVMLKASAGGGGRGMRVVDGPGEMAEAFARCRGEAQAAFGDGALFLEKIVPRPRHIEVQVLADGQRQRRPPLRARLLGAAAQPEGRRGRAGARPRRRLARSASSPTP